MGQERKIPWLQILFVALVVSAIIAMRQGWLPPVSALLLEGLVLCVAAGLALQMRQVYQHDRGRGKDVWQSLEDGLAFLAPRPLARLLVVELRLWTSLFRWIARRRLDAPVTFSYLRHSSVGVMLIALLFSAPAEFLLYELLIPWPWVRVLLLVLGIYAIFWALGFVAALHVLPHTGDADGMTFRYGVAAQAFIPYTAIRSAAVQRRHVPGRPNGFRLGAHRQTGIFAVGGMTQVSLTLNEPIIVQTLVRRAEGVTALEVAIDAPELFVTFLRQQLATVLPIADSGQD